MLHNVLFFLLGAAIYMFLNSCLKFWIQKLELGKIEHISYVVADVLTKEEYTELAAMLHTNLNLPQVAEIITNYLKSVGKLEQAVKDLKEKPLSYYRKKYNDVLRRERG